MALTYTLGRTNVVGDRKTVQAIITFPNPYVVGGIALDAATLGLVHIDHVDFRNPATNDASADTLGFIAKYIPATGKVMLYKANGTTNLIEATAVDTSAILVRCTVTGY